jgi:hypothetical protein
MPGEACVLPGVRVFYSFAGWTLVGHGIVLVLSTGQEFWLTLAEASF